MGIVNLTDDSYFAGSRVLSADGDITPFLRRTELLLAEGAEIIDIGACSTRPGFTPVGEEEEWRRLEPALRAVKRHFPGVSISIDTYWSSVVRKACDLVGNFIVNDISAGDDDPEMLPTVGRLGLPYIAMHKREFPQEIPVHEAVAEYFRGFAARACEHGITEWTLDPGFGFAKTLDQNYELLRHLDVFEEFGRPVLVGISRKSMIYKLLGITPEEALPATQAAHFAALQNGADILRVHDAAEARNTINIYKKLLTLQS